MTPRPSRTWLPLPARLPALLPAALSVLLSACAGGGAAPPGLSVPPFGSATRAALALQIANPDAARQAQARGDGQAAGVDGRAASQAQGRYQKGFAEAAPQQGSFTIGVSGAK
ncbi:hypothetical protein ASD15_20270 [Massilia sp. Root351]|jgi:hypothetical protein|uniref:hypothetical protein n=1 Tax=Massilia sp. Root351 TaxID=1736522 RepID=UPI000714D006|nr:hypothetical protein [Massilia sp. Root351]KQV79010.1 hypothetical protein ASD15_20270 [Massilia sp. Root351]